MNKENIIRSANYSLVAKYLWISPTTVKNYFNAPRVIKKSIDNPKDLRDFIDKYEFSSMWIYCIENVKNWKKYIGKSVNMYDRKRRHFYELRKKNHDCRLLQDDFDIFWEESFDFRILEKVSDDSILDEIEKRYMLRYSIDVLYNIQFARLLDFFNYTDLHFVRKCLSRRKEVEDFLDIEPL